MVILSPHPDDAVFSCGHLLANRPDSTVVTVFAGLPDEDSPLTEWDERCGFASGREAMQARRDEDAHALGQLGVTPRWLDFLDAQYGRSPSPHELGEALLDMLRTLDDPPVVLPMGLFHSDHLLVHEAGLWALRRIVTNWPVYLYEDIPYRRLPGLLQQRLQTLATLGLEATPATLVVSPVERLKARAVSSYVSQLRALGADGLTDLTRPERLWDLRGACGGLDDA